MVDFPGGSDGKASAYNAGDLGSIPASGRSPGEGNGNHSTILAWKIPWTEDPGRLHTVHGVAESRTRLSDFTSLHFTSLQTKDNIEQNLRPWKKSVRWLWMIGERNLHQDLSFVGIVHICLLLQVSCIEVILLKSKKLRVGGEGLSMLPS